MVLEETSRYRFGPFTLDPSRRLLERDGSRVALTPRVFDTLVALVESHGRVVEKKTLMDRVWKDTFVEEGNLTQTISVLRHALGDGHNGSRYIATVTRRGYSFVASVSAMDAANETPSEAAPPSPKRRRSGAVLVAALVGACVLAVGSFWLVRPPAKTRMAGVRSIAVLPFQALGSGSRDYLGLALADAIITR